ncbi:MAG: hypothetical protein FJ298_09300 [Planctomycetes bacterium]|nr:hypothetical protein [Planctomycetota bacterium]
MLLRPALCCFVLALASAVPTRADTTLPGFALTSATNPAPSSVSCSLSDGDFVTFDGLLVQRWNGDGSLDTTLASFQTFVFPSFIRVTPAADAVVIGDSGTFSPTPGGDLRIVWLDGSGSGLIAPLAYNFDGKFFPNGELLVSAAPAGFGVGTDLFRVNITTGALHLLGHLDGPSGPVAVGRNGDVFYGTQQDYSLPSAPQSVLRWSGALVAAGTPLSAANAVTYAAGLAGSTALEFEPGRERLLISENSYSTGSYRIVRVRPGGGTTQPLLVAQNWISTLRFERLGDGTFDAYQPGDGLRIAYTTTDFFSTDDLVRFAPARPQLALSGPGLVGAGAVVLSLSGGVPNGSALLTYCPQTAMLPQETSYLLPYFLLRTSFTLPSTVRMPFLVPTDINGAATVTLWNPGGLAGQYGWQFLVGRPNGTFIGASDVEQF